MNKDFNGVNWNTFFEETEPVTFSDSAFALDLVLGALDGAREVTKSFIWGIEDCSACTAKKKMSLLR